MAMPCSLSDNEPGERGEIGKKWVLRKEMLKSVCCLEKRLYFRTPKF
jgi:hypothetical protein